MDKLVHHLLLFSKHKLNVHSKSTHPYFDKILTIYLQMMKVGISIQYGNVFTIKITFEPVIFLETYF